MLRQHRMFFCGPFPSPITGQTVTTDFLYRHLEKTKSDKLLVKLNTVRGSSTNKIYNYFIRAIRLIKAIHCILRNGRYGDVTYISVDGNSGMVITLLLCSAARIRGTRVILHHHTARHIDQYSHIMDLLTKVAGVSGRHLTICKDMSKQLSLQYPRAVDTDHLSNIIHVSAHSGISKARESGVRLGYMSKLTPEKGLPEAIRLLSAMQNNGMNASLHLAGSFPNHESERAFKEQTSRLGDSIKVYGFLDGVAKSEFFRGIDLFLFPTVYRNETQGIVNLEALAHGVPVAAFARCCIASDLENSGGLAVQPGSDYVREVLEFLGKIDPPGDLTNSKHTSLARFLELKALGERDLRRFEQSMIGTATQGGQ